VFKSALNPSSRRDLGLTWTGTTWDFNADLNTGILLRFPYTNDQIDSHEVFEKDGYFYMLQSFCRTDAAACANKGINGYRWAGNTWEVNYDINRGLPEDSYNVIGSSFSVYEADIGNHDWWLFSGRSGTSNL